MVEGSTHHAVTVLQIHVEISYAFARAGGQVRVALTKLRT